MTNLTTGWWVRIRTARSNRNCWNGAEGQIVAVLRDGLIEVCFGRNTVRFFQDEVERIPVPEEV